MIAKTNGIGLQILSEVAILKICLAVDISNAATSLWQHGEDSLKRTGSGGGVMQIELFLCIFFAVFLVLGKFVDWIERRRKWTRDLEASHRKYVNRRNP